MATVDFTIKRFNGHNIQRLGGNNCVVHWAVFVKDKQQFIAEVKEQINHGDFSCLSLKS